MRSIYAANELQKQINLHAWWLKPNVFAPRAAVRVRAKRNMWTGELRELPEPIKVRRRIRYIATFDGKKHCLTSHRELCVEMQNGVYEVVQPRTLHPEKLNIMRGILG